jgi:hypothetical protein
MRITYRLILLAMAVLAIVLIVVERSNTRRHAQEQLSAAEQEAAALARAQALEETARRNLAVHLDGRHCLDPKSGALPGIYAYVKSQLSEPDSFEPLTSEISPTTRIHGTHLLKLTYRAARTSGDTYQRTETFVVQNADCLFER